MTSRRRRKARVVSIEGVDGLRIEAPEKPLVNAAGRKLATLVRRRIRRGVDGDGPLPRPEAPNKPLRRSGELLKSIKWNAKKGLVMAMGSRSDSNLSNAALLAVQTFGRRDWVDHDSSGRFNLMLVTPEFERLSAEAVDVQLKRLAARGKAGVMGDADRRSAAQQIVSHRLRGRR